MVLYYRYIGEVELSDLKGEKREFWREFKSKYFTPDFQYSTGDYAQRYCAIPTAPKYRLGPLDKSELGLTKAGDVPVNRRAYAAFGFHGGGWEVTFKTPIRIPKGLFPRYDLIGSDSFFNSWEVNEWFEKTKESLKAAIDKAIGGLEGWEKPEYNFRVKDLGIIIYFNRAKGLPPFEYSISISSNQCSGNLTLWCSAWWDYGPELFLYWLSERNSDSERFDLGKYYVQRINKPEETNLDKIREWAVLGPLEIRDRPTAEDNEDLEKWESDLQSLIEEAVSEAARIVFNPFKSFNLFIRYLPAIKRGLIHNDLCIIAGAYVPLMKNLTLSDNRKTSGNGQAPSLGTTIEEDMMGLLINNE